MDNPTQRSSFKICHTSNNDQSHDCVHYNCSNSLVSISGRAILDKGSNACVMSKSMFTPQQFKKYVSPYAGSCTGISGPVAIVGRFKCDQLTIGKTSPITIRDMFFDVIDSDCPVLIGQSILGKGKNRSLTYDYDQMLLKLERKDGGTDQLDLTDNLDGTTTHFETFTARSGHEPKTDSEFIKWAQTDLGVKLDTTSEHAAAMARTLYEFKDIFSTDDIFGRFPDKVELPTEGRPISCKKRNIPQHYKERVAAEIKRMLDLSIIERCDNTRGWLSPILVIPKKGTDKVRIVVDFKQSVNKRVVNEDSFPAPSIDEVFHTIRPGNEFFSTMDLCHGYWQLELEPHHRHKTAFEFAGQTFQFKRCPMGLKFAGNAFVRAVSRTMLHAGLREDSHAAYIDDLAIYGPEIEQYLAEHRKLFSSLRHFNLKLKPSKCLFLQKSAVFLGQIIDKDGRRPDPEMISGITSLPPPTTKQELRKLCGHLTYLRHFISAKLGQPVAARSFSTAMAPLYRQLKENVKFNWTDEMNATFEDMKSRLSSAPIISHYDPTLSCILDCDASNVGVGAVLLQVSNDGKLRKVGAKSKLFTPTEQRWSTSAQEAFGLVWGCEVFESFLKGKHFIIHTDHKSLKFLDKTTFREAKISRWQERLSVFNFTINWIPGVENCIADCLSRPYGHTSTNAVDGEPQCRIFKARDHKTDEVLLEIAVPSWVMPKVKRNNKTGKIVFNETDIEKDESRIMSPSINDEKCKTLITATNVDHNSVISSLSSLICKSETPAEHKSNDEFDVKRIQTTDKFTLGLIRILKFNKKPEEVLDTSHPWYSSVRTLLNKKRLHVDPNTGILYHQDHKRTKVFIPYDSVKHYCHRAHTQLAHAGRNRTEFALRSFY